MIVSSLVGPTLVGPKGKVVHSSKLDGKVVGFYFGAGWCGHCRLFVPFLRAAYKTILADGKDFEVVFVSSDRSRRAFSKSISTMPWLSLPFDATKEKTQLASKFGIAGIPVFVIVDEDGQLITKKGRQLIKRDPQGKAFPWRTRTMLLETIGTDLVTTGSIPVQSKLRGRVIGLFFSASWCDICIKFTAQLLDTYTHLRSRGANFEIVYCSYDATPGQYDDFMATVPWVALPFHRRKLLRSRFKVKGVPILILVDTTTGATITKSGRGAVLADPTGEKFPWGPVAGSTVLFTSPPKRGRGGGGGGGVVDTQGGWCLTDEGGV